MYIMIDIDGIVNIGFNMTRLIPEYCILRLSSINFVFKLDSLVKKYNTSTIEYLKWVVMSK